MEAAANAPRPARLVLSPDDDAALAARAIVRFHLRAFTAVEEDARAGQVEPVHQLRVATRRLRAALRLFAPLLPARTVDSTHRELAWLARTIGSVRDLDVLFETIKDQAARLDPELRNALGPVGLAIHDQRAAALAALVKALDGARCRRLLDRLAAFAESASRGRHPQNLGAAAPALVQALVRPVGRAGARLEPTSAPAEFHRLRVRVKRLRYGLETLRSVSGKPVRRLIARLEELQDVLGESQDGVTQIAWLRAYATTPDADVVSFLPVGALVQALARRGTKRRRRGLKAWRKLERSGLLDDALSDLSGTTDNSGPPREAAS